MVAKDDFCKEVRWRLLLGTYEKILWVEKPKDKSLLGRLVFSIEEEGEGDLKRINEFHLSSSPIFLLFYHFLWLYFPLP